MKTQVSQEVQDGKVTREADISELYIHVTANFKRETFISKGTPSEQLLGVDHVQGSIQLTFDASKLKEADGLTLKGLIEDAIKDAQTKLKK